MDEAKRGPGRPKKEPVISPELQARRRAVLERKRNGSIGEIRHRLAIPESGLDRENFQYRIVNDVPGRLEQLTKDDTWEVVPRVEDREMNFHVDRGTEGQSVRGHLVRKPKQWFEEDRAEGQARIDREMNRIKRGAIQGKTGEGLEDALTYTPDTGIQIQE